MKTLTDLRRWAEEAPAGTTIPTTALLDLLDELEEEGTVSPLLDVEADDWRVRLWTVPADTRLGVAEVAEALGRPKSYVYARTGERAEDPLPCRKIDGTLIFTAGDIRTWLEDREEVVHRAPARLRSIS